jgi:outer membrane protein assembly factor BamB
VLDVQGKPQLIVAESEALRGLDPAGGEPIWWCKGWGFGASPAYAAGLLYTEKGNEPAQLVDPTGQGDVTATHVRWKVAKMPGDYASPVIVGEYIYKIQKEGVVACLKLATGEPVFAAELEGVSKLASPVATADGRLYFGSTGKSYVIKAAAALEVLGTGDLGGSGNGSSPAVSGGRIFIRDFDFLYCLGKKP